MEEEIVERGGIVSINQKVNEINEEEKGVEVVQGGENVRD